MQKSAHLCGQSERDCWKRSICISKFCSQWTRLCWNSSNQRPSCHRSNGISTHLLTFQYDSIYCCSQCLKAYYGPIQLEECKKEGSPLFQTVFKKLDLENKLFQKEILEDAQASANQFRRCPYSDQGCPDVFCSLICGQTAWKTWHRAMCLGWNRKQGSDQQAKPILDYFTLAR